MNIHQIATEAATRWTIQLRQWLGHDIPEHWTKSLTTIIEAAIEKALKDERTKHLVTEGLLIEANKELRAAHASEK